MEVYTPSPPSSPECPELSPSYPSLAFSTPTNLNTHHYYEYHGEETPYLCPNTPIGSWEAHIQNFVQTSMAPIQHIPWPVGNHAPHTASTLPYRWASSKLQNQYQNQTTCFSDMPLKTESHGLPDLQNEPQPCVPDPRTPLGFEPLGIVHFPCEYPDCVPGFYSPSQNSSTAISNELQMLAYRLQTGGNSQSTGTYPVQGLDQNILLSPIVQYGTSILCETGSNENVYDLEPWTNFAQTPDDKRGSPCCLAAPASHQDSPEINVTARPPMRFSKKRVRSRSFKCSLCEKTFPRNSNRTSHMETHNPNRPKPYPCLVAGCNFGSFARIHDLDRHTNSVSSMPFLSTAKLTRSRSMQLAVSGAAGIVIACSHVGICFRGTPCT